MSRDRQRETRHPHRRASQSAREDRHLRGWAGVRTASGIVLTGLGIITLAFGGNDWKTYGWTLLWLALAAAQVSFASWLLAIARSESAQA